MRKVDLNELYGGYWEWSDQYGDGKGGKLEIKQLREHLQEWVKMTDYDCIRKNKQDIQDFLDGTIELEVGDTGKFGFRSCKDDIYDGVWFEPLSMIKDKIRDEAREQGIKPPKTWYREEVDRLAYNTVNPDLPF